MTPVIPAMPICPIPLFRADGTHPERRARRGELVRVVSGVYAPADEWRALAPWERYLARVHAVALTRPDAVFCLESAAALHGMPIFGDPVVVHILESTDSSSRLVGGVRVHKTSGDRRIVEVAGMLATDIADTAVDLARHRHNAVGLAAADAALRLDSTLTVEQLVAINEGRLSKRGRAVARWPLLSATPLSESAGETISRAVIEWLGFPAPMLQVVFRSASGEEDRSDFVWPDAGLAGESDGDIKYDGRFGPPAVVLRRQGERDARLRRHVRSVAHWGWWDSTTFDPMRTLLNGHGLRQVAPENTLQLFSLRRAVSPFAPHRTGRD